MCCPACNTCSRLGSAHCQCYWRFRCWGPNFNSRYASKVQRLIPVSPVIVGMLLMLRGMATGIPYVSPNFHPTQRGNHLSLTRGKSGFAELGGIAVGASGFDAMFNPLEYPRSSQFIERAPPSAVKTINNEQTSSLGWLAGLAFGLMPLVGRADVETPLPKLEDIIKNAIERGKLEDENDLKFKQQYYFVRDRKTEIRNAGRRYQKLKSESPPTPQRNGCHPENQAPLGQLGHSPAVRSGGKANSRPADMPRKLDKNQLQFNLDLVKRFDFKLVGREQTNGYSLLVVDFTPKNQIAGKGDSRIAS